MKHVLSCLLIIFLWTPATTSGADWQSRDDWRAFFDNHDTKGTILVIDERGDDPVTWVYDESRARTPMPPASTYKIPHALFALEAGIVRDEFQVFEWDGTQHNYEPWNRDQTLRSSMRHSTVWVYERFAETLWETKVREYLSRAEYGNAEPTRDSDATGETKPYWVNGNLKISAQSKIKFLQKLYCNELPFKTEHQRLVKDIMIVQAEKSWILRAKTGWTGQLGWWVGWVEHPEGPVFFALNIDTPNRYDDLDKRQAVTRDILRSIGALPEE